jgi:hypothetical protein
MGTPMKPDPEKFCEVCGVRMVRKRYGPEGKTLEDRGRFRQRRTCSQSCANTRREVTKGAHHWRARQHRDSACSTCGSTEKLHVHHKDRNPENDDPSNLVTLCASCHLRLHWREDRERRLAAARQAAQTAARRGVRTPRRSTDGRFASAG